MNTRISNDVIRKIADNEFITHESRYQLNTPGNGINLSYDSDVHCRLQRWGANLVRNSTQLESEFFGITKPLTRYDDNETTPLPKQLLNTYPTRNPYTQETQTLNPAWTLKGIHIDRQEFPIHDPQANIEIPFPTMINTTMLAKDHYEAKHQEVNKSGFNEIGEYFSLGPKPLGENCKAFYSDYNTNFQEPQFISMVPGAARWHLN